MSSAFPGFGRIRENAIIIDLRGKKQAMEIVNFHLESNWIIFPFEKSDYFAIKDMWKNGYNVYQMNKYLIHSDTISGS